MKGKEYYNKVFRESEEYKKPYKDFLYYDLYKRAMHYIDKHDHILELGCGTGQFSEMLSDNLHEYYIGLDFSEQAIDMANKKTLYDYHVEDITKSKLNYYYNTVIAFEIFEHLEYERVLKRLNKGAKIIFSVPNFLVDSHIYKWDDTKEIKRDFKRFVNIKNIEIPLTLDEKKWFLINGIIK